MVHKFTESMTDVGSGIGSFTEKGLYPLATLPVIFGVADMSKGIMKGVENKMEKEDEKKKQKSKNKKKKK